VGRGESKDMTILQPTTDSGKRGGYLHFVGEQPAVAVDSIAQITAAARHRFPNAVLHRFFGDIHGGRIFRTASDAVRYGAAVARRFGYCRRNAYWSAEDMDRFAPVGYFFVPGQPAEGCRR